MKPDIHVIGAGLAGCEAAWQLAEKGFQVALYEMRPTRMTPAHQTGNFAELVCSNSLRSNSLRNGVGLLKEELRQLKSLIMQAADQAAIPAGSALAVDRDLFSTFITEAIQNHKNISVIHEEVTKIPEGVCIIASGPLTSVAFVEHLQAYTGDTNLYFYDAVAPIVRKDSIDFSIAYYKSRYDVGEDDYINCPMSEEQYHTFYDALIHAETVKLKDFEKEIFFEGCMPIEEMAKRGPQTLLFGPLKPVGLATEEGTPHAVVQLRRDNAIDTLYNLVGFQTHLSYGEQKRVFQLIPGLENAEFVRYGNMHRNTYINSPQLLNKNYQMKEYPNLFFAGQITGVEGYVESVASGLLSAFNCARYLQGKELYNVPNTCMIGAMANYIAHANPANFQPMNANFGIMRLRTEVKKSERRDAFYPQSMATLKEVFADELG